MVSDMRPFLWHNYHEDESSRKCKVNILYTSYVDISCINKVDDVKTETFKGLGYSRRQESRHALKEQCEAYERDAVDSVLDLYTATMKNSRAREESFKKEIDTVGGIVKDLMKTKRGKLFFINNKGGSPVSSAFFGFDRKRAYYLYGANDPEQK